MSRFTFTSESVTEGHPDKVCDQISDAVVDYIMSLEGTEEFPKETFRCACETMITPDAVIVAGEYRAPIDSVPVGEIVYDVLARIGYDSVASGFDPDSAVILNNMHGQSPDIALGVDKSYETKGSGSVDYLAGLGAGDQGMMFGYACNETEEFMPVSIYYAHLLSLKLAEVRHSGEIPYLYPDGKSQVTFLYENDVPVALDKVLVSAQHQDCVSLEQVRRDIITHVIIPVFEGTPYQGDVESGLTTIYVNPTGRFVVGGPTGDCGLTGRKIVVDTYGGWGRIGGGCFSGKDCTKVDRSAAYMARYIAKNIVAAGFATCCEVQLAYAIGVSEPQSIMIDTFDTEVVDLDKLTSVVIDVFDCRPGEIIREFDMFRPIYSKTAVGGHFGRSADFPWERINKVEVLKQKMGE